jgi:nitroreductase
MKLSDKTNPKSGEGLSIGILEALRDRRAVRHYTDRLLDETTIKTLLDYAIQAPSAVNSQPWSFVVIQKKSLLDEISVEAKKIMAQNLRWKSEAKHVQNRTLDPDFNIFYNATTLIIICAYKEEPARDIDCYLASENLMLAAHGMGLGTCPIGLAWDALRTDDMKQKIGIPKCYNPVLPIIVGYPAGITPRTLRNPPQILNWITS